MPPRVVILGAGYAGVGAAHRLVGYRVGQAQGAAEVVLVDPRRDFVERVRLHQHVSGTHMVVHPLEGVVPQGVELVLGSAAAIDPAAKRVRLSGDGGSLDYDYLIYAVGSHGQLDHIEGARAHAVSVGTWEEAENARTRVGQLADRSSITVVGAGLTGIETAAELADSTNHSVRMITDGPVGHTLGERGRRYVRSHLYRVGVAVIENVCVATVHEGRVDLVDGRSFSSDLTIVATAVGVPDLARASGLATNPGGSLSMQDTLVSTSDPFIIGAGDAAALTRSPLRMSCQAAIPSGVHAAETALHLAAGRVPKDLQRKFAGQCVSLGKRDAIFQATTAADAPRPRAIVTGRAAALVKERLCSSAMWFGHRGPFGYSWS